MQRTPTYTLLERLDAAPEGPSAWVLPGAAPGFGAVLPAAAVQPFRPEALALERMGVTLLPELIGTYATLFLLPPREMDWGKALVADCLDHLKPGGILTLAAPKDAGGKRWPKLLAGLPLLGDDSKHHHRIVTLRRPEFIPKEISAWSDLALPQPVPGTPLLSAAGLFSHGEVDPASALLAEHLPALHGRVADLGAGWGYLSWAARQKSKDIDLHLYEADARALALAEKNVPGAKYFWHDIVAEDLQGVYDSIIMNPPFHDRGHADIDLGRAFIARASAHLGPHGFLWLVANRHLPYEDTLKELFPIVTLLAQEQGYKVYKARHG